MNKILCVTTALLLVAPLTRAMAHDDDYYSPYWQHQLDHQEHHDQHEEINEAHQRAHEEGFADSEEHRDFHRALREHHDEFHEDHPGTWHDHDYNYGGGRPYGYYNDRPPSGFTWFAR